MLIPTPPPPPEQDTKQSKETNPPPLPKPSKPPSEANPRRKSERPISIAALSGDLARERERGVEVGDGPIQLALVDLAQHVTQGAPGRDADLDEMSSLDERLGRRMLDTELRARVTNQSMAEQSKPPPRPSQSARATRASSSRSTFCASRRKAPSPTGGCALANIPGFR